MLRNFYWLTMGLLLLPWLALAHPEWKEASCIGVIDEQNVFTLTLKFDVPSYLLGKIPKEAPVADLDALMLTPGRLPAAHARQLERFLSQTKILADGKPLTLTLLAFPTVEEIKAQSAKQGEADRYPVLLNAKFRVQVPAEAEKITLTFPAELGSIFTNLRRGMEFQTVMAIGAGETSEFVIGEPHFSLGNFLKEGFQHVLPEGWDHCLFMMAMFLGAASLLQALTRSLIFTVGHSITLTLVAMGAVGHVSGWIEPIIAFTIGIGAWLAYKGKASERSMLIVPFTFGLVHGLGFAAAVTDKLSSWQNASILQVLIGFNLGVELAQVSVILALASAVRLVFRTPTPPPRIRQFLSLGIALIGFGVMFSRIWELVTAR
jgi:hydrogenase/urease accessory protein HupE